MIEVRNNYNNSKEIDKTKNKTPTELESRPLTFASSPLRVACKYEITRWIIDFRLV